MKITVENEEKFSIIALYQTEVCRLITAQLACPTSFVDV